MATFRINYYKVINQANTINDLSWQFDSELLKLEDMLSRVKNGWYGPASDAFQKELRLLIQDMKSTRASMTNLATTIKTVANRIQNEDNRLAREMANH